MHLVGLGELRNLEEVRTIARHAPVRVFTPRADQLDSWNEVALRFSAMTGQRLPLPRKDQRMRVSLFITCFNDTLFPNVGIATTHLLERLGHTVDFPSAQTCCGQMHYNTGYQREALPLIRRFVDIFSEAEVVVAPSASCVGMVRDIYPHAAGQFGDAQLAADVAALLPRVFELTEFLAYQLGLEDVGAYYPHRVTYHPTCHSLRILHVGDAPLRLLRAVRGIDLVELPAASECCGFGGTFALKNADTSLAMLSDKVRHVLDTRAEVCVSADTSCLMHIGGALHRERTGVRTLHIAEILASTEERSSL